LITYVDTSTLLKRLLIEDGSDEADIIWNAADVLVSAAAVIVEARAALAAAGRANRLTAAELRHAKAELAELLDEITLVEITEDLAHAAGDVAEAEALRGYDAMHLAAALAVEADVLTSADAALCDAAERRGLHVANPLDA
jgi:predicted nucleic acid-binding protein